MSSRDFSFLKGNIYTIILCSLYGNGEQNEGKYGYEIAREIKERTENKYEIKQPTLYSYLKKLEDQGQIQSFWGSESNGGRRRYYKLTPRGRKECEQFVARWQYHKDVLTTLVDTSEVPTEDIAQAYEDILPSNPTQQKQEQAVIKEAIDEQDEISRRLDALLNAESSNDQIEVEEVVAEENDEDMVEIYQDDEAENVASEEEQSDEDEEYEEFVSEDYDDVETAEIVAEEEQEIGLASENESSVEEVETEYTTDGTTVATTATEQSTEEHKAKFDVHQDNADEFLQNFDARAREVSESRETPPENTENYQHVLMNVIGNQLDDMQDYNSEQSEGAQKYYSDHPVALEDVADDLAKQGIRMRIYNHASSNYKSKTLMPISGVLCKSAWITFAAIAVYFCILIFTSIANNNWRPFVITLGIIAIFPIVLTVIALYDPSRKEKPSFRFRWYLTATIIIATIIVLAALGISIISGIELNNYLSVSKQILLPVGIALILPLYVVVFDRFYQKY